MTTTPDARGTVYVLRKTRFFAQMNAAVERLRANPEEWADYQEERSHWDVTLADGIERTAEQAPADVSG